jgi:hypothetical protein
MCGGFNYAHKQSNNTMNSTNTFNTETSQRSSQGEPSVRGDFKKRRRVSFCNAVKVVLIPCLQEYKDADLMQSIWWLPSDHQQFQYAMGVAFRRFLTRTPCSDLKVALRLFIADEVAKCDSPEPFVQHVCSDLTLESPAFKRIRV